MEGGNNHALVLPLTLLLFMLVKSGVNDDNAPQSRTSGLFPVPLPDCCAKAEPYDVERVIFELRSGNNSCCC